MTTSENDFGMHCEGLTYWDFYNLPGWPRNYSTVPTFKRFRIWDMWDTSDQFGSGVSGCDWNEMHFGANDYNFSHFDGVLDSLAAKSVAKADTMYTFGGVPEWLSGSSDPAVPFDVTDAAKMQEWDNFVYELVYRATTRTDGAGVSIWGLWNEPNAWPVTAGNFWKGTPAEMYALAAAAYQVIKSVDSTAIVVSPEIEGNGAGWLGEYFAAGGDWCQDVIGVHYYDVLQFRAFHEAVLAECANYGVSKPFMLSEWGWTAGADVSPASYIAKGLLYAAAYGFNGGSMWYSPDDVATGTMVTFDSNNEPNGVNDRPASWNRVHDKWLTPGRTVSAPVYTGTGAARKEITITGPGGYEALAVWNDNGMGTRAVTAGKYKQWRTPGSNTKTAVLGSATTIAFDQTPRLYENQATA